MSLPHHDLPDGGSRSRFEACGQVKKPSAPADHKITHKNRIAQIRGTQATILDFFDGTVLVTPEAEALRFGSRSLTYAELDAVSNRLAHYLRSRGIKEDTMIPICMDRSLELIIGILGILKAGGAYVPIDPHTPLSQVQRLYKETDANLALVHSITYDKLATNSEATEFIVWEDIEPLLIGQPESRPVVDLQTQHLAYVIFTSGSTGKPKGVLIEHAQLYNATMARRTYYKNYFKTLLIPSVSFDASLAAIFGSLCSGGCLIICRQEDLQDPQRLEQLIPQIDTLLCVPSYYQFLLDEGFLQHAKLSKVILGGEAITPSLVSSHFEKNSQAQLYNEYGPTETTIWATVEQIESADSLITIGLPIEGADVYVLDREGHLLEENTTGELYIGGKGVARGYLNDPENTAAHFIQNPFTTSPSRLYKTGDLCYKLPDGRIVFVGRTDDQVKINGYRIETSQIESALQQIPGVRQAAVIAKESQHGAKSLVAFVQPHHTLDKKSLRAQLQKLLPNYMIPNLWVQLDDFPLTPNGKLDRQALSFFENIDGTPTSGAMVTDPMESFLLSLWRRYLPTTDITVDDDFFEAGGNSIMAMSLVAAIRRELKINLNFSTFFERPTIAKLAQWVKPLTSGLSEMTEDVVLVDADLEGMPLSYGQESFWLIDQMGESKAYHLPIALQIKGNLNVKALTRAIRTILQRHEPLRTTIKAEEDEKYRYLLSSDGWTLSHIKHGLPADDLEELIQQPFDLSKDFMVRAWLIQTTPEDNILLFVIHHVAFDAWSKQIFLEELWSAYHAFTTNSPLALPPLSIDYTTFAREQKSDVGSASDKLKYWKAKLQDFSPLQLPRDRFAKQQNIEGTTKNFTISSHLLAQLRKLSRKQGVTDFMTLLAGFKVLLHRYSSQEDIVVGTTIAGRELTGTEALIGYFVNSLPLRTEVKGVETFLDVLDKVKQTTLEAYDAKEVPFEQIVAETGAERKAEQNPLFQVMFTFQNVPQPNLKENNNLILSALEISQTTSKFDLTFSLTEAGDRILGEVEYRTGTYHSSTIDRMIQHYLLLLETAVQQPSESIGKLNMIGEKEQQLLRAFNQTSRDYSTGETILDLLESQARRTPDKTAVVFGDQRISYQDLDTRSNQLAHLLREKGAREETLVLLCMNRSLEMIIAVLGILKSGAAYVPVDPTYPQERKKFIQEDTAAQLVVTDAENQKELSGIHGSDLVILEAGAANLHHRPTQKVKTAVQPDHLAYVIYTSGSTGRPKGVMIEHGNVFSFISWCKDEFSSSPIDVVYAATSICFDLSVFEIFYPLNTGIPIRLLENGLEIKQYLPDDHNVMINTVPSVVGHLLEEGTELSNVSVLNMAGEPITKAILDGLDVDKIEVRNLYGPTEDTTYSTIYRVGKEREVLIGTPISNTCVYIVNQEDGLNPVGVPGEICLGGAGLARGYFNRPDLTDEKFVPNPFVSTPGARMYKTGDIGRWLLNGQIEYLGRKDDQVKIRGYRIELGEIERALQQHEKVRQAVVLAKADHKGNQQLVGYLVIDGLLDKKSVMAVLKQRLPLYMVPSLWVQLEAFPLTPNGKIDKKKLPDPIQEGGAATAFVAPRNGTEKKLAQIWQNLLGTEKVGIYDDFFASGGHSLMATRFIAAVRKEYGTDLRLQDFFAYPTIAGLAENCSFKSKSSSIPELQAHYPRPDRLPLSYNQESLWFIDQLSGSKHYHIPVVLELDGILDQVALELALQAILERHEVLRTVIQHDDGVPHQVIKDPSEMLITMIDGSNFQDESHKLQQIIAQEIAQPFDLSVDYMVRGSLVRLSQDRHLLVLVIHHIAFDGWSTFILLEELTLLYKAYKEGSTPIISPLLFQYSDYAVWQKQYLQGDRLKKELRFWKQKLRNTPILQLPLDHPRPQIQSHEGSVEIFKIENEIKEKLLRIGQQHSATLFMTLLTAFKVLLYRYSSQHDICVGTVTAGRQQKDTERLIGYFSRTLPIRSTIVPEASFLELLEEVKSTALEAFENQEVPFEKIVAVAGVERDLSKNPLFQVMFVLQNYPEATKYELPDIKIAQQPVQQVTSKFDLSFIIAENPWGLQVSVEFKSALFKQATIERIFSDYLSLLKQIVSNPSEKVGQHPLTTVLIHDKESTSSVNKVEMLNYDRRMTEENLEQKSLEASEKIIGQIWRDALGIPHINVNDNFFEIGGHSLAAVQVISLLEKELGRKLPLSILFKHPTIREMAQALKQEDKKEIPWRSLVSIKPTGNKPPLYIVHGGGSNILPFYGIAKNMHPDQPVYGLQPKGLDGKEKLLTSVEAIASHYISEILHHNPDGVINLAGYSFGGIIAFEMAQQLKTMGKEVKRLIMFDTIAYQNTLRKNWQVRVKNNLKWSVGKRWFDLYQLANYPKTFWKVKKNSLDQKLKWLRMGLGLEKEKALTTTMKIIKDIENNHREASMKYQLKPYDGEIHLMKARIPTHYSIEGRYLGWDAYVRKVNILEMEGEHTTMFAPPHELEFAKTLQNLLN